MRIKGQTEKAKFVKNTQVHVDKASEPVVGVATWISSPSFQHTWRKSPILSNELHKNLT